MPSEVVGSKATAMGESHTEHREAPPLDLDKTDRDTTDVTSAVAYGPSGLAGVLSSGPLVIGTAFLASLGGFSFGYDQGE